MRKITIATVLMLALSPSAFAQTHAVSRTESQAVSAAQNAGNAQSITFNSESSDRLRKTPDVAGNGFYGSFSSDSCVTSAGGGFAGGLFGMNAVTPVRDEQCSVLRGVERTMQVASTIQPANPHIAAKLQQGAIDMLCNLNDTVGDALKGQGVCTEKAQDATTTARYTGNDPIVRRRLGID